ncbi:V-set and immunoglobulin domain-containing protein 10 [Discoglossus pictus]
MGSPRLWTGQLLLVLCIKSWTAHAEAPVLLIGEVDDRIVLPCTDVTINTQKISWFKDNATQPVLAMDSDNSPDQRFSRVNVSSLVITRLQLEDEGNYSCRNGTPSTDNEPQLQLRITSGPYNISASIFPNKTLPNGTLYTSKGSSLQFVCSSYSIPVPMMAWVLYAQDKSPELFHSSNDSSILNFTITNIASNYQGNFSCSATNPLSSRNISSTLQLLVYYQSHANVSCYANSSVGHSELLLSCTWPGGYPAPLLQWEQGDKTLMDGTPASSDTDTLVVSVNRSQLSDGQWFQCRGNHLLSEGKNEKTCKLQIGLPVIQSHPMRSCFSGENVTLSCSVTDANPPATISWLRNVSQPEVEIQPGEKYQIWQNSSLSYLTIVNCSHETDEGYYVCKAENALGVKEINVWLSITKPHNIVGLVSVLLLLFLLVVALITGIVLYCDPQFYLKD